MKVLVTCLLTFLSSSVLAASPTVSYILGMSRPSSHLFEVDVVFDGLDSSDQFLELLFPVWRTGRYVVLDLANGVVEFHASDEARNQLQWRKENKHTWRIATHGATKVHARYKVFAHEFHLRTRGLNDERAFVDGTAVFMYAERYRALPLTLTVLPFGSWRVTTGLDRVAGDPNRFSAPNYDYFVDCPLEIGTQQEYTFSIEGKEHILSITGEGNYEPDSLVNDISRIVKTTSALWNGLPYERFLFMTSLSPTGGGGTEHINSTVIMSRPFIFKNTDSYLGFLSLISHEFFHVWNVKRLRPAGIVVYDWTKENYTKELWFAEGTTSYYDDLLLARAGLFNESQYLDRLALAIEADLIRPGNLKQSLAECSFDAWIKQWKPGRRSFNYETDYYSRGAAVSFVLDMTIRRRTKNRKSLDDVMRWLWERFASAQSGYTNADIERACATVTGSSFGQFFSDFVDGANPLPWKEALQVAGFELVERSTEKKPSLGIATTDEGERVRVSRVIEGSPAFEAGIDIDDEIVALNGYKVRSRDLLARIGELKEGDKVRLTVFRDERLREFEIILRYPVVSALRVVHIEKPDALQKAVRSSWLNLSDDKK